VPSAARPPIQRENRLTVTNLTTETRLVNGKFTTVSLVIQRSEKLGSGSMNGGFHRLKQQEDYSLSAPAIQGVGRSRGSILNASSVASIPLSIVTYVLSLAPVISFCSVMLVGTRTPSISLKSR
jgi:hypothetical protein